MTTSSTAAADTQRDSVSRSYIDRHWRGELSLAKSYWLNGILIVGTGGVIVFYLAPLALTLVVFGLRETPLRWVLPFSFLAWFGAYIWVWGGIWRSAGNYRGPRIWSIAARIAVVIGVAISLVVLFSAFLNLL
ncbi:MAG: hypothetical protein KGO02_17150 [Alphaproteobacteria bacterium]|nr:hypothetical protein [Alphaproteobacteria bacterium]